MILNLADIARRAVDAAAHVAGQEWPKIQSATVYELRICCQRLADLAKGVAEWLISPDREGAISPETATMLISMARNNFIMNVAMTTTATVVLAQRMLDAALGVIRDAVNTAAGLALL